jgi:putative tryptophan/tyrosine transport system substrate-binding protein
LSKVRTLPLNIAFAENHNERLPALAADLIHRQVTVLVTPPTPAALAAKAATSTVPIVFLTAGDPVQLGLVDSFAHPGGNATGVAILAVAVAAKRLELLHELIPAVHVVALMVNPENPSLAQANSNSVQSAARTLGLELPIYLASKFDLLINLKTAKAVGITIPSSLLVRADEVIE